MRRDEFQVGQIIKCSLSYFKGWRGRVTTVTLSTNRGVALVVKEDDDSEINDLHHFDLTSPFAKRCTVVKVVLPVRKVKKTTLTPGSAYMERFGCDPTNSK